MERNKLTKLLENDGWVRDKVIPAQIFRYKRDKSRITVHTDGHVMYNNTTSDGFERNKEKLSFYWRYWKVDMADAWKQLKDDLSLHNFQNLFTESRWWYYLSAHWGVWFWLLGISSIVLNVVLILKYVL